MEPTSAIYSNGVDGDRGHYAHPPCSADEMLCLLANFGAPAVPRRMVHGIDCQNLAEAGWGVVWPDGTQEERRRLLAPLIERRRHQAGPRFQEFTWQPDQSSLKFLETHGAGPGPVDPEVVPYYLLIAATPEEIPFDRQSELGVSHAVGRLSPEPPEDAQAYIEKLVAFEESEAPSPRRAAFWGVEHRDDPLTWLSAQHLAAGLETSISVSHRQWSVSSYLRHAADKRALRALLVEGPAPSFLFTASHGLTFSKSSPRQSTQQGALLCADYPGPEAWDGPIPEDHLFAAQDLEPQTNLSGLVVCSFACFSAGTPRCDVYASGHPEELATRSFVAPLAQALLARGALGVIGHVDITFEQSFLWHTAGPQRTALDSLVRATLAGVRLGEAMDYMSERYAQLAARVAAEIRYAQQAEEPAEALRHLHTWAAYQDARHFVLLGDPAARLNL